MTQTTVSQRISPKENTKAGGELREREREREREIAHVFGPVQ